MHREVLRIYSLASPTTRPYYQFGQFQDGSNEDNWVIRWMLWNVFRYGMNRKNARGTSDSSVVICIFLLTMQILRTSWNFWRRLQVPDLHRLQQPKGSRQTQTGGQVSHPGDPSLGSQAGVYAY